MSKPLPPVIPYHQESNHMIPNQSPEQNSPLLGKFGRLRREYLKMHKPHLYDILLLSGGLNTHLTEINRQAWERMETLQQNLLRKNPLPQTRDTMELTRHRRMIQDMSEEIVLHEIVYNSTNN